MTHRRNDNRLKTCSGWSYTIKGQPRLSAKGPKFYAYELRGKVQLWLTTLEFSLRLIFSINEHESQFLVI